MVLYIVLHSWNYGDETNVSGVFSSKEKMDKFINDNPLLENSESYNTQEVKLDEGINGY